jgi:Transposase DDE domain
LTPWRQVGITLLPEWSCANMKYAANPLQGRLFDPYQEFIPPLGLERIKKGWQAIFRAILLALMPVKQLGAHFHPTFGRPTKEHYSVAGLLFLQESNGWTNAQAIEAYLFHTDVQFALNLEPGIDQMCERTLERYRVIFLDDDLAAQIMNDVTLKLVDALDLCIDQQRLDSTHVFSDMASFGRTRMMAVCNKRFLTQVQRHHVDDFNALPEDLRQRYAPSQAKLFASKGLSAEQRGTSRQQVAEDMRDLLNRFADHPGLNTRPSYQALLTVFGQQCEIVGDKIVVKAKTGGRCVQNPSDPDATYDGCKGQGHKVQLVETCSDENDVQLILTALPQTAADHDANSLTPILADLQAKELLPEVMLADTAYGSDENVQAAAKLGVELLAPMPGPEPVSAAAPVNDATSDKPMSTPLEKLTIDDFSVDERTGKVGACPSGRMPLIVLYEQGPNKDKTTIEMRPEDCESCPFREACPMQQTKKGKYQLDYTAKQRRQQERRREEDTDAFRQRYAKRSGLESTNGGLKRKHGLGELRVRGSPAVRHALFLKVAGWNLGRATASGRLASQAAAILMRIGFGGWWATCCLVFGLINRINRPCRPLLTASAA